MVWEMQSVTRISVDFQILLFLYLFEDKNNSAAFIIAFLDRVYATVIEDEIR